MSKSEIRIRHPDFVIAASPGAEGDAPRFSASSFLPSPGDSGFVQSGKEGQLLFSSLFLALKVILVPASEQRPASSGLARSGQGRQKRDTSVFPPLLAPRDPHLRPRRPIGIRHKGTKSRRAMGISDASGVIASFACHQDNTSPSARRRETRSSASALPARVWASA